MRAQKVIKIDGRHCRRRNCIYNRKSAQNTMKSNRKTLRCVLKLNGL